MSSTLKIERDTVSTAIQQGVQNAVDIHPRGVIASTAAAVTEAATGNLPGTKGHHPVAAVVGTAITGGRDNAGTKGYLAVSDESRRSQALVGILLCPRSNSLSLGLHQATREPPASNQGPHRRHARRRPGADRLMAGEGPQQAWKLLHIACP